MGQSIQSSCPERTPIMKCSCLPAEREKMGTVFSEHFQCGQKLTDAYFQKDKITQVKVISPKLKDKGALSPPYSCRCFCCFNTPSCCLSVTLSLISFAPSEMLCAVREVILEFLPCADIYRPPPLPHPPRPPFSLCPLSSAVYFSRFLSASCQHWQRATQALAALRVTDAAAVRQRGKKEQELKQRETERKRGKTQEKKREKETGKGWKK